MTDHRLDVVVHHHEDRKAPLLRAAVLPALHDLPAAVGAHLERGWLRGPHLRVCMRSPAPAVDAAAAAVAGRLIDHLRAHPSRAALSPARLAELAAAAGRAELVPPPYGPFAPDNTVRVEAPDRAALARVPGSAATAQVRATLLGLGVPAVAALVADTGPRGDTPGARVRAAVVALAAHAAAGPAGLLRGQLSYRSHLEAHLHHHDPDGRRRAAYDAAWQRHGDELTALVAAQDDPAGAADPATAAWRRWGAQSRQVAGAAYDRGVLVSAAHADTARRAAAFGDPELSRVYARDDISAFHRALSRWQLDDAERRRFEIERFCVNMLYLLLAVADVTPAERYLAGSLVCAAVERFTGTTWQQLLARADPAGRR